MPVTATAIGGNTIADEVFTRIGGRLTTAQIIPYANRALALIEAAASYVWDLHFDDTNSVFQNGLVTLNEDVDVGKKISVFDMGTGLPLVRVTPDEINSYAASGFKNTMADAPLNVWELIPSAVSNTPAALHFVPPGTVSGIPIKVIYHKLPPVLAYANTPALPWFNPWMNDLCIDYTESIIKRIYNMVGWQALQDSCQARLIEAKSMYSSERMNTGPTGESQTAEAEKTNLGRV